MMDLANILEMRLMGGQVGTGKDFPEEVHGAIEKERQPADVVEHVKPISQLVVHAEEWTETMARPKTDPSSECRERTLALDGIYHAPVLHHPLPSGVPDDL
jgi:hypothetical protein